MEIMAPVVRYEGFDRLVASLGEAFEGFSIGKSNIQREFYTTMGVMVGRLDGLFESLKPIGAEDRIDLVPPKWKESQEESPKKLPDAENNAENS